MDEEITCLFVICQKSLDNVNDVETLDEREGRELTEQAENAMTSYKLFQVRRYSKHVAANTATQVTLRELRKRRGKVQQEATPEESSRESRSNCHLHREHESHTEEG